MASKSGLQIRCTYRAFAGYLGECTVAQNSESETKDYYERCTFSRDAHLDVIDRRILYRGAEDAVRDREVTDAKTNHIWVVRIAVRSTSETCMVA